MIEIGNLQFRATVTDLNAVTVPKEFRQRYDIEPRDEIVLELKGKISKTEKFVEPKEVTVEAAEE